MNTEQPFDEREAQIVQHIAEGGTIRSAADLVGVDASTITRWLQDESRTAFRTQYAHAREAQADAFADEIIDVARDKLLEPSHARLRVDALKWAAGKRKPKVYGDKQHVEHSGRVGLHEASLDELD